VNARARLTERELFDRLGWFVSIRWAAGVAALLLVAVAWHAFGVRVPLRPVVLTTGALFAYNAVFFLLVRDAYRRQRVGRHFIVGCANAQILCDVLTLAVLMHFTGGVENPFLAFFICPLVVASALLSRRNAYTYAGLGALLINAVAWLEFAGLLPHVEIGANGGMATYRSPLAVTEFTVALSLLLFATVFLGSSIAGRLRRREAELEDAYEKLQALEESKSFLMRRTSHDLRAPLDALVSLLRAVTVEAGGQIEPRLLELLGRAEERALGLSRLIDELHRYAILRDATTPLPRQRLDFAATVRHCLELYAPKAAERQVRLAGELPGEVFIDGNPGALGDLVGNLVSNAVQYTPAGGEIRVRLARVPGAAQLEVADTGMGIPPDALPRVFDEFYRAPNAKDAYRNGTGLGLPIARRIAEAHGGTVAVRSTLGRGTTFTVTLPETAARDGR
jgi:signal transduction histidine kinase